MSNFEPEKCHMDTVQIAGRVYTRKAGTSDPFVFDNSLSTSIQTVGFFPEVLCGVCLSDMFQIAFGEYEVIGICSNCSHVTRNIYSG